MITPSLGSMGNDRDWIRFTYEFVEISAVSPIVETLESHWGELPGQPRASCLPVIRAVCLT